MSFYINKPPYNNIINKNGNITDNNIIKIKSGATIKIGNHRINTVLEENTENITLDKNKPGSFYFINKNNINIVNQNDLFENYHFYIAHKEHKKISIKDSIGGNSLDSKLFYHIKLDSSKKLVDINP